MLRRVVAAVLLAFCVTGCGRSVETRCEPAPPAWAKVAPEQIAEAKKHGVPVAFENDHGMRFARR